MRSTYFRGLLAVAAVATLAACSGSSGGSGSGGGGATTQNPAPAAVSAPAGSGSSDSMGYGAGSSAGASGGSSGGAAAPASGATLGTASTSLGTIVVDGKGMTAYMYDKDTKGATSSVCTGSCATFWPAIEASSTTPKVTGVTGKVATITGVDGKPQVTLDGWPLYTFAQDAKAGDTNGQGYDGIWWVLSPAGAPIGK